MAYPYKFKNIHSCEAVVLSCIDFRFWKETVEFVEKELKIKSFDFPSLPGSAKAINDCQGEKDAVMQCISVPCNLHHAKILVIVNHEDCGAYGGSKAFNNDGAAEQEFHEQELKKARAKVLANFPDLKVILLYVQLADNKEKINFLTIN